MTSIEHEQLYSAIRALTDQVRRLQLQYPKRHYSVSVECDDDDVSVHVSCKPTGSGFADLSDDLAKLAALQNEQAQMQAEATPLAEASALEHTRARLREKLDAPRSSKRLHSSQRDRL